MIHNVKILSIGRKWVQISLARPNGPLTTRVLKTSVPNAEVGMELELSGEVQWTSNGYGSTSEFVVKTKEDYRNEKIERAISSFRKGITEGYVATRAVETLRQLACHEYDAEIQAARQKLQETKAVERLRSGIEGGYINKSAVSELHSMGIRAYDAEIQAAREKIRADKEAARQAKKEAEVAAGIVTLALPAHFGFSGKPRKGEHFMHKGIPYRTVSSYYNDADGWSFGAQNDEWYSVKAIDISGTAVGEQMIAKAKASEELSRCKKAATKAKSELERTIRSKKSFIGDGHGISDLEARGTVVWDTWDLYGGGDILIRSDNHFTLIINNGADGDNWGLNNIATGGAGAYGYECPLADCEEQWTQYQAAVDAVKDAQTEYDKIPSVNM